MTNFARETWTPELFGEILPLAQVNWQEMNYASSEKLSIDFLRYHDLEAAGRLRLYTVRKYRKLVGYSVFFVAAGTHNSDLVMASHDALYVIRGMRGPLSVHFIKWCNKQLFAEGIVKIVQTSRLDHPIDKMLLRLGYKAVETLYTLDNPRSAE